MSTENRKHSTISPSKLKALEICPAWRPEENEEEHPLTAAGIRMHRALETGDDSQLQEGEHELVNKCREWERAQFVGLESAQEIQLDIIDVLNSLGILDKIFGYADKVFFNAPTAYLVDYKFSAGLQEDAETNPAAQAYALGIFKVYLHIDTVEVYYLYPRRDEISHAIYVRGDMEKIELRIRTTAARTNADEPDRNYDATNCLYCGNKVDCPVLHAMVLPIATRYAARKELQLPKEWDPALITDPGQMSKAMDVASVMGKWVDSVKHHALKLRQETGVEVPGYDLRSRAGRKTILNAKKTAELVEDSLNHDEFLAVCEVNAKALLDAVGSKAPKGAKKATIAATEDRLRDAGVLEIGPESEFLTRSKS